MPMQTALTMKDRIIATVCRATVVMGRTVVMLMNAQQQTNATLTHLARTLKEVMSARVMQDILVMEKLAVM